MTVADRCQHNNPGFGNRLEYCTVEAADPKGIARLATNLLDDILYSDKLVVSDEFHASFDNNASSAARSFTYAHGDFADWVQPPIDTRLTISHTYDKTLHVNRYAVAIGWTVFRADISDHHLVTRYAIDVYPQGPVQACVEVPNIVTSQFETAAMTHYDYRQLCAELELARHFHDAESHENAVAANGYPT